MMKTMPLAIRRQLEKVTVSEDFASIEEEVIVRASELGYEVEDEYDSQMCGGGFMHNVKVVNAEGTRCAWIHFNHPSKEYAHRKGEWYWYIM